MTYIDALNDFNLWLESNVLPASSQLMYFKLLNVFNRAGWPEYVQVDNCRLMNMIGAGSERSAISARDRLVEAGFLEYQKGRKGCPNRYRLTKHCKKHCNFYSTNDSISDSENDSINDSISDSTNVSHIKTKNKNKTKTKNNPPQSPPLGGYGAELQNAFADWLAYKAERRQGYKPTGLKSLTTRIETAVQQHGEKAVADLIRECMANGWQGIIWDRLERGRDKSGKSGTRGCGAPGGDRASEARASMTWMDEFLAEQGDKEGKP